MTGHVESYSFNNGDHILVLEKKRTLGAEWRHGADGHL